MAVRRLCREVSQFPAVLDFAMRKVRLNLRAGKDIGVFEPSSPNLYAVMEGKGWSWEYF